jgi:hypothetical protein
MDINQEKKDRVERCRIQMEALLAEHECRLEAIMHVTARGVKTQIMIVPVEPPPEGMPKP